MSDAVACRVCSGPCVSQWETAERLCAAHRVCAAGACRRRPLPQSKRCSRCESRHAAAKAEARRRARAERTRRGERSRAKRRRRRGPKQTEQTQRKVLPDALPDTGARIMVAPNPPRKPAAVVLPALPVAETRRRLCEICDEPATIRRWVNRDNTGVRGRLSMCRLCDMAWRFTHGVK